MTTTMTMRRLFSGAATVLLLMLLTTATAWADTGNEADGVYYKDADGTVKNTATDGIDGNDTPPPLTTALINENYLAPLSGWYVVNSNQTFNHSIDIIDDAHVILADGFTLTSNWGILVKKGTSLTIYGQTAGTGTLIARGDGSRAAIGAVIGINCDCGTITINGGTVTATGGEDAAGIGGGKCGSGGIITINGGTVTAYGGACAAGIGGGRVGSGGNITINGGTVTAYGETGCGIGSGSSADGGNITINGGTVTATASSGTGIGGENAGGNICILGGKVTATGTGLGSGIGSNSDGGATITLGWTDTTDYIKASGNFGNYRGTVTIATGQTLYDGKTSYSGAVADASAIGSTLRPYEFYIVSFDPNNGTIEWDQEVKAGQTATAPTTDPTREGYDFGGWYTKDDAAWNFDDAVTKAMTLTAKWTVKDNISLTAHEATVEDDTNYWTTFYCGDAGYSLGAGACAYTAEYAYDSGTSTATLTLHRLGRDIPQATAVVIVASQQNVAMTKADGLSPISVTNHLRGVDVRTEVIFYKFNLFNWDFSAMDAAKLYVMGQKSGQLGFYEYTCDFIPARKAILAIGGDNAAHARSIVMTFGEETGISNPTADPSPAWEGSGSAWYTLDGRRLEGKPAKKGIFIHNGRKEVLIR